MQAAQLVLRHVQRGPPKCYLNRPLRLAPLRSCSRHPAVYVWTAALWPGIAQMWLQLGHSSCMTAHRGHWPQMPAPAWHHRPVLHRLHHRHLARRRPVRLDLHLRHRRVRRLPIHRPHHHRPTRRLSAHRRPARHHRPVRRRQDRHHHDHRRRCRRRHGRPLQPVAAK